MLLQLFTTCGKHGCKLSMATYSSYLGHHVLARYQLKQRRLSGSVCTDEKAAAADGYLQAHVLERWWTAGVAKRDADHGDARGLLRMRLDHDGARATVPFTVVLSTSMLLQDASVVIICGAVRAASPSHTHTPPASFTRESSTRVIITALVYLTAVVALK